MFFQIQQNLSCSTKSCERKPSKMQDSKVPTIISTDNQLMANYYRPSMRLKRKWYRQYTRIFSENVTLIGLVSTTLFVNRKYD